MGDEVIINERPLCKHEKWCRIWKANKPQIKDEPRRLKFNFDPNVNGNHHNTTQNVRTCKTFYNN